MKLFDDSWNNKATCPNCGEEFKWKDYIEYTDCQCGRVWIKAKDLANLEQDTHFQYKDIKLAEWLIEEGYIKEDEPLDTFVQTRTINDEIVKKFRESQEYDVLVFSKKNKKPILTNESVSYSKAKEICNSDYSKFANSFAGFAIHGEYENVREGEPF